MKKFREFRLNHEFLFILITTVVLMAVMVFVTGGGDPSWVYPDDTPTIDAIEGMFLGLFFLSLFPFAFLAWLVNDVNNAWREKNEKKTTRYTTTATKRTPAPKKDWRRFLPWNQRNMI